MKLPALSLEKWSFVKVLYPTLNGDQFLNLVDSLGDSFFDRLEERHDTKKNEKPHPIATLYSSHIFKIASGRIIFV